MVDSCRTCEYCTSGDEQFCENGSTMTYAGVDKYGKVTNGGYSTHIVAEEDFVLRVPEGLSSESVAPLLCAGITLYSPLKRWGAGPGKKVAIVGMGGLGHMGVKIAAAMGAEVTVLSQTLRKADDAKSYGAARCFATSDEATFQQLKGQFDVIINTVSAPLDFAAYLKLLKVGGAMVVVGLPDKPVELQLSPLIMGRRILAGSLIGGIKETQEMLDFCGQHHLGAEVEVISAGDVNDAYDRVVRSDVRYRFVIDASTIASAEVEHEAKAEPVGAH
ncbi:ubiquinone biosynthesis methyltransferase UbiE [Platysternon megacephalum]|uniref:Ubiquinone biosynthesis methyltransferase UbiE n=1 Tax=Platysternon megacephalum TaxID=55544 RepID=A0A4D9DE98_9SAUR|nr:ubiquinone biosynthesis methyltransferase UbiE [Platysternon megacephalum]